MPEGVCVNSMRDFALNRAISEKEREEIIIPLEDLSPIAQPLAQKKLLKKLHKTIKKGTFGSASRYTHKIIRH